MVSAREEKLRIEWKGVLRGEATGRCIPCLRADEAGGEGAEHGAPAAQCLQEGGGQCKASSSLCLSPPGHQNL